MDRFQSKLEIIDSLIRRGEVASARVQLESLRNKKVPREFRPRMAQLARRCGWDELCLRLLSPLLFPADGSPGHAKDSEKAEYAAGLINMGAVSEAQKMLAAIPEDAYPTVALFQGLACMAQWDYSNAVAFFSRASQSNSLQPYQRLVARVNLAAALVHESKFTEATLLLQQLKTETQNVSPRLHGNVQMAWAELKIRSRDFQGARDFLSGAEESLATMGGREGLFVNKWNVVLALASQKIDDKTLEHLESVKQQARQAKHWETVRDCDFYRALYLKDAQLMRQVFFGTPHESYRKWILKQWTDLEIPQSTIWNLKQGKNVRVLNLFSGKEISLGQAPFRMLAALCSDFYRPLRVAELHAAIYPDERYDVMRSRRRVQLVARRLRHCLVSRSLSVVATPGEGYRLKAHRPISIRVDRRETLAQSPFELSLNQLAQNFVADFSANEAAKCLGLSSSGALLILGRAVREGRLVRSGNNRSTRYQFFGLSNSYLKQAS